MKNCYTNTVTFLQKVEAKPNLFSLVNARLTHLSLSSTLFNVYIENFCTRSFITLKRYFYILRD